MEKLLLRIGGFGLIFISLLVFIQVVARYVFNSPFSWSEELARIIFIWISFVGAYIALRQDRHIGIEALMRFISPQGQKIIKALSIVMIAVFVTVLTYQGILMILNNLIQRTPAMQIPIALVYLIIPLTGVLMLVELVRKLAGMWILPRKDD